MADDVGVSICRVVVVDEHRMFAEALRVVLSAEDDLRVVGTARPTDPELVQLVGGLRPDVVVIDVGPLGARPSRVVGAIGAAVPGARVVVLTAVRDVPRMTDVARAGAAAWLPKESPTSDLLAAIRAVRLGHACYPPADLGAVLRALADTPDRAGDPLGRLSGQERRVLGGMVDGLTGPELATALHLSLGTVRTHTRKVFTKLGVHSRLEAVKVARAAGVVPTSKRA